MNGGVQTTAASVRRTQVLQGQSHVSDDPNVEFNCVLGSCVSACLYDKVSERGGMNHFLLAEPVSGDGRLGRDQSYGAYLMELLINAMLAQGSMKRDLSAYLFGGAHLYKQSATIGQTNARFALEFLDREGIPIIGSSLGGASARRVDFRPARGQVRWRAVDDAPPMPAPTPTPTKRPSGDFEIF